MIWHGIDLASVHPIGAEVVMTYEEGNEDAENEEDEDAYVEVSRPGRVVGVTFTETGEVFYDVLVHPFHEDDFEDEEPRGMLMERTPAPIVSLAKDAAPTVAQGG